MYTILDADTDFNVLPINEFFSTPSFKACCSSLWNHKPPHNKSSFDHRSHSKGERFNLPTLHFLIHDVATGRSSRKQTRDHTSLSLIVINLQIDDNNVGSCSTLIASASNQSTEEPHVLHCLNPQSRIVVDTPLSPVLSFTLGVDTKQRCYTLGPL